jgi:hypothetical protein
MLLFEMIMAMRRLLELKTYSECIQVIKHVLITQIVTNTEVVLVMPNA